MSSRLGYAPIPECGFSLRIDKGEVTFGRRIEHKH